MMLRMPDMMGYVYGGQMYEEKRDEREREDGPEGISGLGKNT